MLKLFKLYRQLNNNINSLTFSPPVTFTYNPLIYAWHGFSQYINQYCSGHKRIIFIGMNPGPWGMAQTGIPFGEVNAVRDFLGIKNINITPPEHQHNSYPIKGLECTRSEVSGRRLWQLFRERYGTAEAFFNEHIVLNYCPLLFLSSRNVTPDKIIRSERVKLFAFCDDALRGIVELLQPEYLIGIGNFTHSRALEALKGININIAKILHPSPASPQSNHNWSGKVTEQLITSGVWQ